MLSFQRLDVYRRAIEFLALVGDIVDELPKGHSVRADQLVRAAESVVRKIAEGAGRWSADSAKHYKIARGEAMECAASLDVMKLRKQRGRRDGYDDQDLGRYDQRKGRSVWRYQATYVSIFAARSSWDVKDPRARSCRLRMENQHSI
jgi:four helix bundle protein